MALSGMTSHLMIADWILNPHLLLILQYRMVGCTIRNLLMPCEYHIYVNIRDSYLKKHMKATHMESTLRKAICWHRDVVTVFRLAASLAGQLDENTKGQTLVAKGLDQEQGVKQLDEEDDDDEEELVYLVRHLSFLKSESVDDWCLTVLNAQFLVQ